MDSTKDSIRRILLGLLACFCLGTQECVAGPFSWLFKPTPKPAATEGQALRAISAMGCTLMRLNAWLTADEPAEALERRAYTMYSSLRVHAEHEWSHSYYSHDMSTMNEYEDAPSLIKAVKNHVDASCEYMAKECLREFISTLEDKELGYDVKALEFGRLFLGLNDFYARKFWGFGFGAIEWSRAGPALARYSAQKADLDKALELTMNIVHALLYVILKEMFAKSPDPGTDHSGSMLRVSLTYGYKLLAPFMGPKLPSSVSNTAPLSMGEGCSDSGGGTGEARLSRSSEDVSDMSSEGFSSETSDGTPEHVARRRS